MHRHFCTYFDHRYLASGLALHGSLLRFCKDFTLWVLALDAATANFLEARQLPNLKVVRLEELEAGDTDLAATKPTRSRIEYYFTCSPCLPRYLVRRHGLGAITYLDSDLGFFSNPEPLFDELGDGSVAIVAHRFSPKAARTHSRFGRYNVGWLTFRADESGLACLDWWRERCLEWCHDRPEGDRYADQKYLEKFERLFNGVRPLSHPGANLAPWNVANHDVCNGPDGVRVDGRPLVFFHFQGLKRVNATTWNSNLTGYGARLTSALRNGVFRPYIDCLVDAEACISAGRPATSEFGLRRAHLGWLHLVASRAWNTLRAAAAGNLVRR